MKYVVCAPGRSGTKYTAHLLTAAGLNCGHEKVFTGWGARGRTISAGWQSAPYDGDSNYIAVPFLPEITKHDITVVHLIRPPLDHIRSIVGIGHVSNLKQPWVGFLNIHANLDDFPPGPARAAAYWVRWNKMIEPHADLTWHLHDIGIDDIMYLGIHAGVSVERDDVKRALAETSKSINARARAEWVTLDDLGPMASEVVEMAERYGVPLETPSIQGAEIDKGWIDEAPEYRTETTDSAAVRTITIEPGKGGWYRLLDVEGNELDKVQGKDRADRRVRELMEESHAE